MGGAFMVFGTVADLQKFFLGLDRVHRGAHDRFIHGLEPGLFADYHLSGVFGLKAADQGDPAAQNNLGGVHLDGEMDTVVAAAMSVRRTSALRLLAAIPAHDSDGYTGSTADLSSSSLTSCRGSEGEKFRTT